MNDIIVNGKKILKGVNMEKANLRKEKKYWSILLVPHSESEVKVIKISSVRYKLLAIGTVLSTFVICSGIFGAHIMRENNALKEKLTAVETFNTNQKNILVGTSQEINAVKTENEMLKKKITEFNGLFKKINNSYIDNQTSNILASRGTSTNSRAFVSDIKQLKGILDSIKEINESDPDISNNLTEAQKKLDLYVESIPTFWPASGRLSSTFGSRSDPFNSMQKNHQGIDIAASHGASIKAAASGKVILSESYSNYGNTIIIDHGNGLTTLYAHCSSLVAKEGQSVKKGDLIAKVGSTGRSTGDHLHFEVRAKSLPVDPQEYLDKK